MGGGSVVGLTFVSALTDVTQGSICVRCSVLADGVRRSSNCHGLGDSAMHQTIGQALEVFRCESGAAWWAWIVPSPVCPQFLVVFRAQKSSPAITAVEI